tara:strand:+ start:1538 stop:1678 length:141 start_codon:yes stop_codon:yes gene_type:complete
MLKALITSILLNGAIDALPAEPVKIEVRRRRGKQNKGRKKGGNGLR